MTFYLEQNYLCVKLNEHVFETYKSKVSFLKRNLSPVNMKRTKILAFVANLFNISFLIPK